MEKEVRVEVVLPESLASALTKHGKSARPKMSRGSVLYTIVEKWVKQQSKGAK